MQCGAPGTATVISDCGSAFERTDHWLTDPQQLSEWQIQLVEHCHAINEQLFQIQTELRDTASPPSTSAGTTQLKVVSYSSHGSV